MRLEITRYSVRFLLVGTCLGLLLNNPLAAQEGGGGGGGVGTPVQTPVTTPTTTDTSGDDFSVGADSDGNVDFDNAADLDFGTDTTDNRNQGFIGVTSTRIDVQGFVGAGSVLGPDLSTESEGISFGGDFADTSGDNAQSAVVPNVTSSGFQAAQSLGSVLVRRDVRARLRPNFFAPKIAPVQVQNQFVSVVSRQPVAQSVIGRFSITVKNKTAYLQGTVNHAAEADYIVRQLRLQPGVYKIVNQLKVVPARM